MRRRSVNRGMKRRMGRPLGRDERAQRQARRVGAIGFVLAALLPVVLWHRVMADIASEFRFYLRYFVSERAPWFLILPELPFAVPVVLSIGRNPNAGGSPRPRIAYAVSARTAPLVAM